MDSLAASILFALFCQVCLFFIGFMCTVEAVTGPPAPKQEPPSDSPADSPETTPVRYGGVILRKTPSREKSQETTPSSGQSFHFQLKSTPERRNMSGTKAPAMRTRSRGRTVKVVEGGVQEKREYFDELSRGTRAPMPTYDIPAARAPSGHRIAKPVMLPQEDTPISARSSRPMSRGRKRSGSTDSSTSPKRKRKTSTSSGKGMKRSTSRGRGRGRSRKASTKSKSSSRSPRAAKKRESDPDYIPDENEW